MPLFISLFTLVLLGSASAYGAPASSAPNPHCLEGDRTHKNLFVFYKESEKYDRKITGILSTLSCKTEKLLVESIVTNRLPLTGPQSVLKTLDLTATQRKYLEQLRVGTSELHFETSGEEYLAQHPIETYTKSLNRILTQKFGNGFSGEIFKAWIESDPKNTMARDKLMANMSLFTESDPQGPVYETFKDTFKDSVLLVSMGLGWDEIIRPDTQIYTKNLLNDLAALGIPVKILKRDAYGSVEENTKTILPQINDALRNSRHVYIMGLCKGAPESLWALTQIFDKDTSLKSHFSGYIGMSSQIGPVYFANSLEMITHSKFVDLFIKDNPIGGIRQYEGYEHALRNMDTKAMKEVIDYFLPRLPREVPYLNLIGDLSGNGLLKTDKTAMGQFYTMNRALHLAKGANDGFLEYPDNVIPSRGLPLSYSVIVDGSHMLVDGSFGKFVLFEDKSRSAVYRALLKTVYELRKETE